MLQTGLEHPIGDLTRGAGDDGSRGGFDPGAPHVGVRRVAPGDPLNLELVCHGRGAHDRVTIGSLFASSGNSTAQGVAIGSQRVDAANTVRVRIKGEESAARIPRELFAGKLHNSAPDGWLKITDLETSPTEIKGRVSLFFTSHPRLRIDRDTGDIEIHGNNAFSFSGSCEKAPVEAAPKF